MAIPVTIAGAFIVGVPAFLLAIGLYYIFRVDTVFRLSDQSCRTDSMRWVRWAGIIGAILLYVFSFGLKTSIGSPNFASGYTTFSHDPMWKFTLDYFEDKLGMFNVDECLALFLVAPILLVWCFPPILFWKIFRYHAGSLENSDRLLRFAFITVCFPYFMIGPAGLAQQFAVLLGVLSGFKKR